MHNPHHQTGPRTNNLSLSSENPLLNSSLFLIGNWCLRYDRIWAHFHNRIGVLYVTSAIRVMTPAQSMGYASDTRGVQPVKSSVTVPFHSLVALVPVYCDDR